MCFGAAAFVLGDADGHHAVLMLCRDLLGVDRLGELDGSLERPEAALRDIEVVLLVLVSSFFSPEIVRSVPLMETSTALGSMPGSRRGARSPSRSRSHRSSGSQADRPLLRTDPKSHGSEINPVKEPVHLLPHLAQRPGRGERPEALVATPGFEWAEVHVRFSMH